MNSENLTNVIKEYSREAPRLAERESAERLALDPCSSPVLKLSADCLDEDRPKQRLYINRKKVYDQVEAQHLPLNSDQLKQLKRSCNEFEAIKRQYLQNYLVHQQATNGNGSSMDAPALSLRLHFDESETMAGLS